MKNTLASIFLILLSLSCTSQDSVDIEFKNNLQRVESLFKKADYSGILGPGLVLIDSVYISKTLDIPGEEQLVLNLNAFDCLTFVENFIVLNRLQQEESFSHKNFKKHLQNIRYRNGVLSDYTSRLHYFSDWITNIERMGYAENITAQIGGEACKVNVNFMSTHTKYYWQLKENPEYVKIIGSIEKVLSSKPLYVIPQEKIVNVESKINDGDIIGLVTNIKGLDYAHNGVAIKKNGRLFLLHASSDFKKIMISEQPLADYVQQMKHMTGISVLRLN